MMPRILSTPLSRAATPIPAGKPRGVHADVLAAVLPGPGRDRLAGGEVLVVTTGQQPALFTGPLYTFHKALSAIALAQRLERERGVPVVPVFWVAGDDHDFAEANHAWVLGADGEPVKIVLRERPHEAPQLPLFRERCGAEIAAALDALKAALPDSEFRSAALAWLEQSYRSENNLADAAAEAINATLASRGLAVFRAHDRSAKRAAAPWLLRGLGETLDDGLTPVLVEGRLGRDRLRRDGGDFVTRRGGERFTRAQLEQIAAAAPERLSPNVLLRPLIEAALFPTVAYVGGPGEMEYLPESAPLFSRLGVAPQAHIPRWSAELESRYAAIGNAVQHVDPTLERTVQSARNAALAGTHEIEKKLVASLKRTETTAAGQLARARAALMPLGQPQERVLTIASFLARYSAGLLDEIAAQVARWAAGL